MITVWNTPIAASVEQILRDLKLMLFAEGLLRDQNNTGSDVMVTCPFHKGGHERKPSCGVSLKEKITPDKTYEAGTVHCFRFFNLKWLTDLKDVNELIQNYGDDFEDYLHRY